MAKKFYAVQHGDNFDWDFGASTFEEAELMAIDMANDSNYDGEEIRIATIDEEAPYCDAEYVVREGSR